MATKKSSSKKGAKKKPGSYHELGGGKGHPKPPKAKPKSKPKK